MIDIKIIAPVVVVGIFGAYYFSLDDNIEEVKQTQSPILKESKKIEEKKQKNKKIEILYLDEKKENKKNTAIAKNSSNKTNSYTQISQPQKDEQLVSYSKDFDPQNEVYIEKYIKKTI